MYGGEMKRQKSMKSDIKYTELFDTHNSYSDDIPMQKAFIRKEPTIEAQILENDTLQAIALRYNCTVAEIKRLNKIDKDNEIHARSVILIPATLNSMLVPSLLENKENLHFKIPTNSTTVRQSTPRTIDLHANTSTSSSTNIIANNEDTSVNEIILNTKLKSTKYLDNDQIDREDAIECDDKEDDDMPTHPIVLKRKNDLFDFSGSDCDISWICLLLGILALCVAIPLLYIFYIAEHPEKFHHKEDEN